MFVSIESAIYGAANLEMSEKYNIREWRDATATSLLHINVRGSRDKDAQWGKPSTIYYVEILPSNTQYSYCNYHNDDIYNTSSADIVLRN